MILAILQARVSSSRLPGKVLKPLLGVPMLLRQIERLKKSQKIDQLLVATSTEPSDDPIEKLCEEQGIACYRGSLNDVLDRFYQAARGFNPKHVVRLTADCPLTDARLIDDVIGFYLDGGFDYASNAIQATYPDGLDMEVFRFSCLEQAWREARLSSQREHVTPFIHQQPLRFKIGHYKNSSDLSHLRWTVDEPKDFELVTMIYETLYPRNSDFSTQDILELLDQRPELVHWNTSHQRNEGYQKSLKADLSLTANPTTEN
jgi:spore coat polysaccharide biosynthesis protein SpsF